MGEAKDDTGPLRAEIEQLERELAAAKEASRMAAWARRFHDDVLQHNRIGYFVIDRQGNHISASDSLRTLLEFDGPLPPHVSQLFDGLFPDDTLRKAAGAVLFEDLTAETPPRRLLPVRSPRGTELWLAIRLSHLPDDQALITVQDVTHERGTQLALGASERRLRTIFDAAQVGIAVLDRDGGFIDANPAFLAFVGRESSEIRATTMMELTHPDDRAMCVDEFARLHDGTLPRLDVEKRFVRGDGETVWGHMTATWHGNANSSESYGIAIAMDITEHRRLEGEMQMLDKLESLGVLAGGIAHDFNNALTAVVGNLSLARMEARPASLIEDRLAAAEAACSRARELTSQLLTFSSGGAPVRKRLDLARLLRDTSRLGAAGSRVRCRISPAPDLRPVAADEGQITQLVRNLVLNAVQAMPEGGEVRVEAHNEPQAGEVVITVADEGEGISQAVRERIFEPFFSTREGSQGLGLSTVYSIAKRHGGQVEIESTGDQGTVMRVRLPASALDEEDSPARRDPDCAAGARVLVMDDEPSVADIAATILGSHGYDVHVAHHGQAALEAYEEAMRAGRRFDAVVLDLTIPGGLGGKETIRLLHAIDGGVRAVVSSGYSNDPVMADHRAHGFAGVLPKPYAATDLLDTLTAVLAES